MLIFNNFILKRRSDYKNGKYFFSFGNNKKDDNIYDNIYICIQNALTLLKKSDKIANIMRYFKLYTIKRR